jgi:hypothetical protein
MLNEHYPVNRIGQYETHIVPVSFETNEAGTVKLPALGYRTKPVSLDTTANKTLAGSDNGTVVLKKDNTGDALATVTIAASAAVGDEDAAPSVTETPFEADEQYSFTTAKSTAGGRALAFLTVEVLPSHA